LSTIGLLAPLGGNGKNYFVNTKGFTNLLENLNI